MKRSLAMSFAIAVAITILAMGQTLYAQKPQPTGVLSTPKPLSPWCNVTAVDAGTGMVTAKENATGKIFQFKVTDAELLKSLKVGQGVYANFGAMQISLNGNTACCSITNPAPGPPTVTPDDASKRPGRRPHKCGSINPHCNDPTPPTPPKTPAPTPTPVPPSTRQ